MLHEYLSQSYRQRKSKKISDMEVNKNQRLWWCLSSATPCMLVTEERLQYNSLFKHALFHMAHHQLSNISYTIWVKANKREVESHETWSLLWPCDTHYTTDMDALLCFNYQTSGQMHANLIPSPNKQINKINGRMAIYQRQESKEGKKPAQLHRINRTSFTDVVSYLSQKNHTEKKEYLPVIESSCLPTFLKNSAASWIGRASSSRYFTSMLQ